MSSYSTSRRSSWRRLLAIGAPIALVATPFGWRAFIDYRESSLANDARTAIAQGRPADAIQLLEPRFNTAVPHVEVRQAYVAAWRARADEGAKARDFARARQAIQGAFDATLPGSSERLEVINHRKTLWHAEAAALERENPRQASAVLIEAGEVAAAVALLVRIQDFDAAIELATSKLHDPKQVLELRHKRATFAAETADWTAAAKLYAEAADFAAANRITLTEVSALRRSAAEAAAKTGDWGSAAVHFEKSGDIESAVAAYVRAGAGSQALNLVRHKNVSPFIRAEAHRAAGDWQLAESYYRQAKRPDAAIEMWLMAGKPASAAAFAEAQGLEERAVELFVVAGDYVSAGGVWLKSGQLQKATDFYVKAVRDQVASGNTAVAARIISAMRDSALRKQLLQESRAALPGSTDDAEAAALFAAGEDWAEAARRYERADVPRAAADAWHRAGDAKAEGAALRRAALQESDPALALRAADALREVDSGAVEEMLDRALSFAVVQRLPETIAAIYERRDQSIEGAERLLSLGELWVGSYDRPARMAHDAAVKLLPRMTMLNSVKALYARREALQRRIEETAHLVPSASPSGTNFYGADRYFERTVAQISVTNPGKRLRSATVVIELSGKAPELFHQSQPGGIRPELPWIWADRRMLEDVGRGGGNYVQRHTIEQLGTRESRSVTVQLNCRQPYRLIASWLEDVIIE